MVCDADSTSLTDAVLLRRVNAAYEEIVGKIIQADGTWQFDDSNYTDHPIATTTLVAGQQDYAFAVNQLELERLEVLDNGGTWHKLTPIDKNDIESSLSEHQETNGLPSEYDKQGGSIFLYPAPAAASVTLTAGLKAYFQRTADVFTSGQVSTGTKAPGFAAPWHILLCYKAALPYCQSYKKDRVPLFLNEVNRLETSLMAFYGRRMKDEPRRMYPAYQNNK